MAKTKKITVKALEAATKETFSPIETFEWNGMEVVVKRTLSLGEVLGVVDGVVDVCFNPETGIYRPELKECAMRMMVLENYANFTMPSNPEKQYELVNNSGAFEAVYPHINQMQFQNMCMAIDEKISYRISRFINSMRQQQTGLKAELEGLLTQVTEFLENVDEDDLRKIGKLLGGEDQPEETKKISEQRAAEMLANLQKQMDAPRTIGSQNNIVLLPKE